MFVSPDSNIPILLMVNIPNTVQYTTMGRFNTVGWGVAIMGGGGLPLLQAVLGLEGVFTNKIVRINESLARAWESDGEMRE